MSISTIGAAGSKAGAADATDTTAAMAATSAAADASVDAPADTAARRRELLRRRLEEAGLSGAARIPRRSPDSEHVPLSFAQSRMWFLQRLEPDSPAYNVCLAITLRGALDVPALRRSLRLLMERHEILRTRYEPNPDRDGEPRQLVDPSPIAELAEHDLRGLAEDERDEMLSGIAEAESVHAFDLAREHSIRLLLLRAGDTEHVLVLTVHHIAWDGFTFNAFSRDLSALYRAEVAGEPAGLDPLPVQYADIAVWQRATFTDERLAGDLGYWRRALNPFPEPLALPTDAPHAAEPSSRGHRRARTFAPEPTARLTAFAREHGATPFMVLLAGFGALLHRYTGATDVPIGSASMNRDSAELERLIGNFGNTLVLRADVSGDPSFAELLDRVRKVCAEGYAHQDLPFDLLVERLRPPRRPGRSVLFDVMLLFLTQGLQGLDLPGIEADWRTVHNDTTQFDLALEAFLTGGGLRIEATYRSELFTTATIDAVLADLEYLLTVAMDDPAGRISALAFPEGSPARRDSVTAIAATATTDTGGDAGAETDTEPRTPAPHEGLLRELFADLLELHAVGPHDDFFALGGHSLLATRLISRIRAALGVEIPIRTVFNQPTAAALAAVLGAEGKRAVLVPQPRPERIPLSFAQRRLWFLYHLEGPSPTYNIPYAVRLDGPLDVAALRAALADLVERHEILRTVYPEAGGTPWQQLLDRAPELRVVPSDEGQIAEQLCEAAQHAFALDREPPLAARLFELGADRHVLSLLTHHIANDGWSIERLLNDLTAAYTARIKGEIPAWRVLPVQYADYTLWQRDLIGDPSDPDSLACAQLAFWNARLRDLPEELALPVDRPRPTVPSFRGEAIPFTLAPDTHRRLRALAQDTGSTVFMAAQAALAALLGQLGAGEDIPLGTPIAGRTDAALDDLVGCFVNTLVLRTNLAGDPTYRELLGRVRQTDLAAYAHQELPFEYLVDALSPSRSLARHPLFQVMLAHQPADDGKARAFGDAALREEFVGFHAARFDLSFHLFEHEDGGGIDGWLVYSADLFDRVTAEDIAARLTRLTEDLADRPDLPLSRTSVLTVEERNTLLRTYNDTAHEVAAETLAELVEAQVSRTPEAVAVIFEGEEVSYAELDRRAERLADLLRTRGAGPERLVAVAVPRSVELIVALLAVVKSGAAYLPLDVDYPAEHLRFMLDDADPVLLLTTAGGPSPSGVPVLLVDDPQSYESGTRDADDAVGLGIGIRALPQHPAYVIYTSGSTGRPKGVVVPHEGIVNRLRWMQAEYGLTAEDRVLQKTPSSFDVSVWEFFWPLAVGAALVMCRPGGHRDPDYLDALIAEQQVTTVHFVPSMLRAFVERDGAGPRPMLRRVLCSGEALPTELARRAREVLGVGVHNLYGPTEASVDVTYCPADADIGTSTDSVPIGWPVWNTRVYVLDDSLRPVAPGVPGELYLGGVQLARGYLRRAGLTASRFVADPFTDGDGGGRLYRTGDRVRWTADGAVEFLGRADDQVKIRGFRVEPGEIAAAVERLAGVAEAAVVVSDGRLVGYVRPDASTITAAGTPTPLDPAGLRGELAAVLPEHMVPATLMVLDRFPLTPSGKLDRKALPAPDFAALVGERRPATALESELCVLLGDTLGLTGVGADDDFFALGGDSIVSLRLVSRARDAGIALTPRQVFERRTPAGLAEVAAVPVEDAPDRIEAACGRIPATPVIRRAVRLDRTPDRTPDRTLGGLSQAVLLAVPETLTETDLLAALQAVLDRHDVLRARWDPEREELDVRAPRTLQADDLVAEARRPARLSHVGMSSAAVDGAWLEAEVLAARDRLDPEAGRMLTAVRLSPTRLLIAASHLVIDGVSWGIIVADLERAWRQASAGRRPVLTRSGTSLREWSALLVSDARTPARRDELAHWHTTLDGVGTLFSPEGATARDVRETQVGLTARETAPLLAGVPEALLTALAAALSPCLRGADTVVMVEGHGREERIADGADLSATVGWFTSMFPLRLSLSTAEASAVLGGGQAAAGAVRRIGRALRELPDHGIGYGLLRELAAVEGLAGRPEPGIVVNYLGRVGGSGLSAGGAECPRGADTWSLAPEAPLLRVPPRDDHPADFGLEVNAALVETPDGPTLRLGLAWLDGPSRPDGGELAERLVRALRGLDGHVGGAQLVPSDLGLVAVTQEDLDAFGLGYEDAEAEEEIEGMEQGTW